MYRKLIMFTVLLFLASSVYAINDDYTYFKLCLSYGESAELTPPQEYICWHSSCRICVYETPEGNRYAASSNICNSLGLECGESSNQTIDLTPPEITINFPSNEYVSSEKYIDFDIEINEPGTLYLTDSQSPSREKRICGNCQEYTRSLRFNEGYHLLTFRAIDRNNNEAEESIEIYVDSKEPIIRSTSPDEGYVNTVFTVEYDEENLQSVVLHYNQGSGWVDVVLEGCEAGIRQTCSSEDIPLEDGEVQYYFTVSDFATSVDSDIITLMVDTTDPLITVNDPQNVPYNNKRIQFDIEVSEDVELLEYLDAADPRGRWKRLCKNCDGYDKSKSFGEGYHDLIIRATDYAGNDAEKIVSFTVDSKDPRIKRIEPRKGKYGNGNFYIKYQEDNLQSISLFYKEESETSYTEVAKTDCPSGKNAECNFYVPELGGTEQGDYSYYFIVYDLATDVQSKIYNFILDSVAPEFIEADKTIDGRKVYFDIELSEDSTLEYLDSFDGDRARFRRLCSRCDSYDRRKTFKSGHHELTLRATDKAGNVNEVGMNFDIE